MSAGAAKKRARKTREVVGDGGGGDLAAGMARYQLVQRHEPLLVPLLQSVRHVMGTKGIGYAESVYQRAIAVALRKRDGLSCSLERTHEIQYEQELVGHGSTDLEIDGRLVVEVKVATAAQPVLMRARYVRQLLLYLIDLRRPIGVLLEIPAQRSRAVHVNVIVLVQQRVVDAWVEQEAVAAAAAGISTSSTTSPTPQPVASSTTATPIEESKTPDDVRLAGEGASGGWTYSEFELPTPPLTSEHAVSGPAPFVLAL
jgi:GxxExxY protein